MKATHNKRENSSVLNWLTFTLDTMIAAVELWTALLSSILQQLREIWSSVAYWLTCISFKGEYGLANSLLFTVEFEVEKIAAILYNKQVLRLTTGHLSVELCWKWLVSNKFCPFNFFQLLMSQCYFNFRNSSNVSSSIAASNALKS